MAKKNIFIYNNVLVKCYIKSWHKMKRQTIITIFWVALFSVAMGFLESAIVVYIRALYYPDGFAFPLKMMDYSIAVTELLRELATIIMLIAIGALSGRTRTEKFGFFIFSFAIWDLFYYVFLKLILNWPQSFFTWDVLFLIPTAWVGPVIAPVLLAILMLVLSLAISYFTDKVNQTALNFSEWAALLLGSLVVILSFTIENVQFLLTRVSFIDLFNFNHDLIELALLFIPRDFPWLLFFAGFLIINSGIGSFFFRNRKRIRERISC